MPHDPATEVGTSYGATAISRVRQELESLQRARAAVAAIVIGQEEVIDQVFAALLCGGHVLVESAPGLGKTLLVRSMGTVCGMKFSRIQFTPDLMPADITGTFTLLHDESGDAHTTFQRGPIFAQMVLADEINRATPKTQSALLEAMQERTVTIAGTEHNLPEPFFVLATQNPIEMEGTYVLPEAQIDRFLFKVNIPFPSLGVLDRILDATTGSDQPEAVQVMSPGDVLRLQRLTREVPISSLLRQVVARFVRSTQPEVEEAPEEVKRLVRYGVSPRGAQSLVLASKAHALMNGRFNVAHDDIKAVIKPALRHRIQLNYDGEASGVDVESLLVRVLERSFDDER
jgi:MoxR-like ATPase